MHEAAKQTHTQANTLNLTYYHNLRNSGIKITTMDNAKINVAICHYVSNVLHGSVVTSSRCGEICSDDFVTNLL